MVLGHGTANQTKAAPTKSTQSPATVNLSSASVLNQNLSSVGGSSISLGQKTEANSVPVVIASNQSTLPISLSGVPAGYFSATASTTGSSSTLLVAAVLGKSIYITGYSINNSSATSVVVTLQDGNGGSALWQIEIPAGGGNNLSSSIPLFNTTSGNALYFQSSSGVTSIYVNVSGFSQ